MQTIIDSELDPTTNVEEGLASSAKYFDVIGFDPRGVNNTTPGVSCFPDIYSRRNWDLQAEAEGMLGSSSDSLVRSWARAQALSESCSDMLLKAEDGEEALGEHVNTVAVVHDMLAIIERHGEWRGKQGVALQRAHDWHNGKHDLTQSIVKRTEWKKGQEKLLYWGISYGTIIGGTFATMFPDRIDRALLDAVVEIEYYYKQKGSSNLADADAIFDKFGVYCDAAGPNVCAMYTAGGPAAIRESVLDVLAKLKSQPIPVLASATRGPEVLTWTDVMGLVRTSMYMPLLVFPKLASMLGDLRNGNASSLADYKQLGRVPSCVSDECQASRSYDGSECSPPGLEVGTAILCTDTYRLVGADIDEFRQSWESLRNDSHVLGDYWASFIIGCPGWKTEAKWNFPGIFFFFFFLGPTTHPVRKLTYFFTYRTFHYGDVAPTTFPRQYS